MPSAAQAPLAIQLQDDIVHSRQPISEVLRKAKILATLLGNSEFRSWIDAETRGYRNTGDRPDYRTFRPLHLGTFVDPLRRVTRNVPIVVPLLPKDLQGFAAVMTLPQSVKEIEAILAQSENFSVPWPAEAVTLACIHFEEKNGSTLLEAWRPLTKPQLEDVLDQVRNRLLDFLLELQQIDPNVMTSEAAIRAISSDAVQNVFNTTILGNKNTVAAGTHFTQTASPGIQVLNTESLCDHLRGIGLPSSALTALKEGLARDGTRPRGQLGDAVKSWIGKTTVKALEGTWEVALDTAATLLKNALFRYYGWS